MMNKTEFKEGIYINLRRNLLSWRLHVFLNHKSIPQHQFMSAYTLENYHLDFEHTTSSVVALEVNIYLMENKKQLACLTLYSGGTYFPRSFEILQSIGK